MRYSRWDDRASSEESNETLSRLALWHLGQIPSSTDGKIIADHIDRRDYHALCHYDLDYSRISLLEAIHCRQALAFFQKRRDLDIGIDRRVVARDKFIEAEELCSETNEIIKLKNRGEFYFPLDVESILFIAQRKISSILGDLPSFEEINPRFGPGATTQVKKKNASARRKLAQKFACSKEFLPVLSRALGELPGWIPFGESDHALVSPVIHRCKVSLVPKSAKTDRVIATEPMLNGMYQLGIGDYMARRLRSAGIDISDQTKNQRLAREGSITGALATLDLSSASDTIAKELVFDLLPIDWALCLSSLRTGSAQAEWGLSELQKFSSMGNCFTFPLETLIFYALAYACVEPEDRSKVSVYGDDIIVPTSAFETLCKVLHCCGFVPNKSKSFASGPFRESCGKDYFSGIDIRPCYIKDALSCADLFVLHNFYKRLYNEEAASLVLAEIPAHLRIWGPDGFGDGHLLGDWNRLPHKRKLGWGGYIFDTFTFKSKTDYSILPGDWVLPSYTIYASPPQPGLPGLEASAIAEERRFLQGRQAAFHNVAATTLRYRRDLLGVPTPGKLGYKRISIYTLS